VIGNQIRHYLWLGIVQCRNWFNNRWNDSWF
jgi:hypothetical protein